MIVSSGCPDVQILQQLALGKMAFDEVEHLATHCEGCERCIQVLRDCKAQDTLVDLMASLTNPAYPPPPPLGGKLPAHLAALLEKLSRLRAVPPEQEETLAHSGASPVRSAGEDTVAGLTPPQGPDEIGRLGGYRVLATLGTGGMGMVYRAEDTRLQRPVALKVMKSDLASDATARERFLREARAAARLGSDHVVTIFQVGEDGATVFLAMELLEGLSLDEWLKKGRKPSAAQAARIGRQIALGLAAAHERGLIHRDVKPGNVWLDSRHQGRVKLLDFGLARGDADDVHLTHSGAIVGTPAYMAPEQARGEKVDYRCDLFSLGVVLYRLTTGQLPFHGDSTMSILTSLALDTPTPPRQLNPDLPPRLAALIERLLAKDRAQRPATAKAVADELTVIEREAVAAGSQPADSRPPDKRQVSGENPPPRQRRAVLVATGLLLLLVGVIAGIVVIIRDKQGNKVAEIAVPEGGSVDVRDNGKARDKAKQMPPAKEAGRSAALPGAPLASSALVQQPTKLPGVRSWSLERRHPWGLWTLAYRPDGKRLAVGSLDGGIHIWEPQTGRLVQVLYGPRHFLSPLAWSPDGRTLAAATVASEGLVRLWDAETGRLLRALTAPAQRDIRVLAWSPDGRSLLAAGERDGNCLAWNVADGKLLRKVPLRGDFATFSPDGQRLAGRRDGVEASSSGTRRPARKSAP